MSKEHKRNLFEELEQSIHEINAYKSGKMTLRTHSVEMKLHQKVDAALIHDTREKLQTLEYSPKDYYSKGIFI